MPGPMGPGPGGPGPHGPHGPGRQKEKIDFSALKKLVRFSKPFYFLIVLATLFAVLGSVTTIIGPDKISDLTNLLMDGITSGTGVNMTEFVKTVVFLVSIYAAGAILNYLQQFIMATVTNRTSQKLRSRIDSKLNRLPLRYFDNTTRGDILSRVTNDVDMISQTLGSAVANLFSAVVLLFGVLIRMFMVNWILALVSIGTALLGFVLMSLPMRLSQKHFNAKQRNLGIMNGLIEEVYTNHTVVRAYNGEDGSREKFRRVNNDLYDNNWKSQFISGFMMPIMNFAGNLSYVLVFIVGFSLVLNKASGMTYGTIMSFVIYSRLISQPLGTFAQSMTSLQQTSAASSRVFEMLDEKEVEDESGKTQRLISVKGDVVFSDVRFGYREDHEIIHGFSCSLKAGQKVAIVGPTGAGKTTIVNLLMRFYETNSGSILIDGVNVTDMKREDVRSLFDMILQDTWLFSGTVRENLVFNREGVTEVELDQAIEAVGLRHFIDSLPHGYDTMLDDTVTLSEGQKQQLTIARAMIKNAPLLILDEATSSVDTRTELVIQEAMDRLTKGRTSFVIAHRLSTIRNADIILVLNKGDVVEQGRHEELLAKGGFYAGLYNSQFQNV